VIHLINKNETSLLPLKKKKKSVIQYNVILKKM